MKYSVIFYHKLKKYSHSHSDVRDTDNNDEGQVEDGVPSAASAGNNVEDIDATTGAEEDVQEAESNLVKLPRIMNNSTVVSIETQYQYQAKKRKSEEFSLSLSLSNAPTSAADQKTKEGTREISV